MVLEATNATGDTKVIGRFDNGTFNQTFEAFGKTITIRVQGNSLVEARCNTCANTVEEVVEEWKVEKVTYTMGGAGLYKHLKGQDNTLLGSVVATATYVSNKGNVRTEAVTQGYELVFGPGNFQIGNVSNFTVPFAFKGFENVAAFDGEHTFNVRVTLQNRGQIDKKDNVNGRFDGRLLTANITNP